MLNISNVLTFDKLKDNYAGQNYLCKKDYFGYLYSYRNDQIYRLSCDQYSCATCRPRLKKDLHDKVCQQVDSNGLNYHMIVTFPGNEVRSRISYFDSFRIMNRDWNKLRKVIKYRFPDFKYIIFPRSQADPMPGNPIGYCHFHVIHNLNLDKYWLDCKCSRYTLGYTFLRFNEDVAGYLHNDFYIDDEWIIPPFIKHYRTSRDIILDPGLGYQMDPDNILFSKAVRLSRVEKTIDKRFHRILPFEEYVKQFVHLQEVDNE